MNGHWKAGHFRRQRTRADVLVFKTPKAVTNICKYGISQPLLKLTGVCQDVSVCVQTGRGGREMKERRTYGQQRQTSSRPRKQALGNLVLALNIYLATVSKKQQLLDTPGCHVNEGCDLPNS